MGFFSFFKKENEGRGAGVAPPPNIWGGGMCPLTSEGCLEQGSGNCDPLEVFVS